MTTTFIPPACGKNVITRPPVRCADGFIMSVQASSRHYCTPKEDGLDQYSTYEIGYPSEPEPLLTPYAQDKDEPTETIYPFVPVGVIAAVIALHGGAV